MHRQSNVRRLRSFRLPIWNHQALIMLLAAWPSSVGAAEPLRIEGAIVTLIEQADVPARAGGALAAVMVHEGDVVQLGQQLAKIDDAEAALIVRRTETAVAIARREAANELKIEASAKAADAARAELKRSTESAAKYSKS